MAVPFCEVVAEQWSELPLLVTTEICTGKTYIITGANTGLGFEAAKHLVALGAEKVIMAVRNLEAGEAAKNEIESLTNNRGIAEVWSLDLGNFESVKAFAKRSASQLNRIDALIENASVALDHWSVTEGYESSVTINIISTFLLAALMLPKMNESAKRFKTMPHLTIVTSEAGFMVKKVFQGVKDSPLAKMNDPKAPDITQRYPLTKLIQHYAGRHLATLVPLSKMGVVINLVNPGLCKTRLSRNARFTMRLQITVANMLIGRTVEMGSRTLLHATTAGPDSHGCYVSACEIKEHQVPDWVKGDEGRQLGKLIWGEIAAILESIEPGCLTKIL
ncbi:putative short-chain dehydrogenase/reductase family protein [Annulohypoxylon nitens]|nr:putative short-chain dehydrogenase/reductase family protein [Annulohypoxylon nitens]